MLSRLRKGNISYLPPRDIRQEQNIPQTTEITEFCEFLKKGILTGDIVEHPDTMATTTNGVNGTMKKRPIRIAGASGGVFDRFRSIQDFAKDPSVDVIFGDWISEISMTFRGTLMIKNIWMVPARRIRQRLGNWLWISFHINVSYTRGP